CFFFLDNFIIRLTSSTNIDFTNNSLASSLAGLTIHDNSNSVNNKPASVVHSMTVKNTVKENLNELSKTVEDDDNAQITEDILSSITSASSNSSDSIHKKSSKEIKSTLTDETEYTIPPSIAEDVLR